MQLQFTTETTAAPEAIWPYYADLTKRHLWDEDLESIEVDGPQRAGTTGRMKMKDMPEMPFTLTEVVENTSHCDRTDVPGIGSLHFAHKILREGGKTFIQHTVRLEKEVYAEGDLAFLSGVFSDVPGSVMIIKREAER